MGIAKTNTTAYHSQTDGLVGFFHRMLTDMLAKYVKRNIKDWDQHTPYVLFAYRSTLQQSTVKVLLLALWKRSSFAN